MSINSKSNQKWYSVELAYIVNVKASTQREAEEKAKEKMSAIHLVDVEIKEIEE